MEFLGFLVLMVLLGSSINAYGAINQLSWREISNINNQGPYIGIVVPNAYELNPLLHSSSFEPHNKFPYFDFAGRHFRIGELEKKVIVVMSGEGMLNAGLATQLLVTLFNMEGVLHYGIAGNVNSKFQIGDVTIPKYWAHTGLWHWQDRREYQSIRDRRIVNPFHSVETRTTSPFRSSERRSRCYVCLQASSTEVSRGTITRNCTGDSGEVSLAEQDPSCKR